MYLPYLLFVNAMLAFSLIACCPDAADVVVGLCLDTEQAMLALDNLFNAISKFIFRVDGASICAKHKFILCCPCLGVNTSQPGTTTAQAESQNCLL